MKWKQCCCWLAMLFMLYGGGIAETSTPPSNGLYFLLNNNIVQGSVVITEIGEQPPSPMRNDPGSTLICVTTNVNEQCCRGSDTGNGAVGDWKFPDGEDVPSPSPGLQFARIRHFQQVRLARENNTALMPVGVYTCVVPVSNEIDVTASIMITAPPPTTQAPTTTPTTAGITAPPVTSSNNVMTDNDNTMTTAVQPVSQPPSGGGATNGPNSVAATSVGVATTDAASRGDLGQSQGGGNAGGIAAAVVILILALIVAVVVTIIIVIFWMRKRKAKVSGYSPDKYVHLGKTGYTRPTKPTPPATPKPYVANGQRSMEMAPIHNTAPVIEVFPEATYAVEGEEVFFKVRVSGIPKPTIIWTFNQQTIESDYSREIEDTGSITFPSCEFSHTGSYTMLASNSAGKAQKLVMLTVRKEGEVPQNGGVAGEGVASAKPLPISEFGEYVACLHSNNNKLFKSQFSSLDKGADRSCAVSQRPGNKAANRFANIIVYDDNRVVLKSSPELGDCHDDYINASHVDGYSVPKKFIAAQGPLPKTLVAFWHMIWQERPPTIVMVTNLVESSKDKCTQYWPDQGSMEVGPFTITITEQNKLADYTIRTFKVKLSSSSSGVGHKVRQYHFTSWPDHGVPDYASPLLTFHRRVSKEHPSNKGPMVCHCSAGVGRTGTFVGIDIILEQATKEGVVDVLGVIKKMRGQRVYMVQAVEQFVFLHDAVLESLTCGDTQISAGNLRMAMNRLGKVQPGTETTGYDHEFKVLEQVSPRAEDALCSWARRFPQLNRNMDFLPVDRWRLGLKNEYNSYLHATIANGYKQQRAFVIAQTPLPATVRNFWKIVYDSNVSAIVQLTELQEEEKEVCTQYWPQSIGQLAQHQDFEVDLISEEPLSGFAMRNLSVLELKSQKAHQVTQFHISGWSGDGRCSNMKAVIDVIDAVSKLQRKTGNHPIMVICNDTVTRSAMFCSIYNTIERCKLEGVVDVFQAVKSLRIHRPGAIQTVDHYKAIFEALIVFLDSFSDYSNFI